MSVTADGDEYSDINYTLHCALCVCALAVTDKLMNIHRFSIAIFAHWLCTVRQCEIHVININISI